MFKNRTFISLGDFIDLYYKIEQKGYSLISSKLHFSNRARTIQNGITLLLHLIFG